MTLYDQTSEMLEELTKLMTNIADVTTREFRFYAIGAAYGEANQKYITIPP